MELKRIGILSLAKIAGIFGVLYGLISGIIVLFLSRYAASIPGMADQLGAITTWGYKSLIIFPILNGIIYFIAGIILAFLYNVFAKWVGGVKLSFASNELVAKKKK